MRTHTHCVSLVNALHLKSWSNFSQNFYGCATGDVSSLFNRSHTRSMSFSAHTESVLLPRLPYSWTDYVHNYLTAPILQVFRLHIPEITDEIHSNAKQIDDGAHFT